MEVKSKICFECKKHRELWHYDGSYTRNNREYQKYCCHDCWKKRSYVMVTFKIKNPRPHGVMYDD